MNVLFPEESAWAAGALHDHVDNVERALPRLPLPRTSGEWARMRERIRDELLGRLGVTPSETCPLDPKIIGVATRRGYRVERIILNSRPRCPVTANLYVPTAAALPAPAALCPHGHARDGKAHRVYQRYFIALAMKGYVVLSYDMMGMNERASMGHRHAYAPLLHGGSFLGMVLWDGLKALDYLCSRPEVDPARIGCTGNSGGGKQALMLSALDERIAVSAPAGHNATYLYTTQKERLICACNMIPGFLRFGEMDYLYAMIAPRPLLMVMGAHDRLFPVDSARRVFRRARRVYKLLGAEDVVDLFVGDCGHAYDLPKREAMYAWFNRFLMRDNDPASAREPSVRTEKPGSPAVTCFPNGSQPADAATVNQLAATDAQDALRGARARLARRGGAERARRGLARLLWPARRPRAALKAESRGIVKTRYGEAEKVLLFTEKDVPVPCVLHRPAGKPRSVAIAIDEKGKSSRKARKAVREALARGHAAAAVDLRGWGETLPRELSDDGAMDEFVASHRGLICGTPLMGMRVHDLLKTRDYLKARWPSARVTVHGIGIAALVACLAEAVDPGFHSLTCQEMPPTFLPPPTAETPHPLSFYLHGILNVCDIPDLLDLLSPTPVRLIALPTRGQKKHA